MLSLPAIVQVCAARLDGALLLPPSQLPQLTHLLNPRMWLAYHISADRTAYTNARRSDATRRMPVFGNFPLSASRYGFLLRCGADGMTSKAREADWAVYKKAAFVFGGSIGWFRPSTITTTAASSSAAITTTVTTGCALFADLAFDALSPYCLKLRHRLPICPSQSPR